MGVIIGGRSRKARVARNIDPPIEGSFRGYWTGMGERRQSTVDASSIPRIKCFVHEMNWKAAQPTQADNTNGVIAAVALTSLDNSIALADTNNFDIKIRVFSGMDSPSWAINLSNPIVDWDPLDAQLPLQTIPKWFDTAFLNAYERFIDALATALSTRSTRIKEVTVAGPTTIYSEPAIKQFASAANRTKAVAAGYTRAVDYAALQRAMRIHHEAMGPLGISSSVAYNPWQEITDAGGIRTSLPATFDLMQYQRTLMGRLGPWQNNSIGAYYNTTTGLVEARGGDYRTMYEYMKTEGTDKGHPIQFQTMTLAKMTGQYDPARPKPTVEYVTQLGGISVEMPNGWDTDTYVTTTEAATLNTNLAANAAAL